MRIRSGEAGYIDMIRLIPRDVDGVEVINASMKDEYNSRAEWYAGVMTFSQISGFG